MVRKLTHLFLMLLCGGGAAAQQIAWTVHQAELPVSSLLPLSLMAVLLSLTSQASWVALACLWPMFRARWRPALLLGLVVCGVPVLGWLTYLTGPAFGLLFLALGLSLLVWPPAQYLRRRRHAQPERGWH